MNSLRFRLLNKVRGLQVKITGYFFGINSKVYWNKRFNLNWESKNGRLQSCLFASGFTYTKFAREIAPATIVDYGCGLGDSMPVLRMAYPIAKLFYYDFSEVAMMKAKESYERLAESYDIGLASPMDLVYCSNVIEHISDESLSSFCQRLTQLSSKYVVIQAPFDERLSDGSEINEYNKSPVSEHVRTLNLTFLSYLEKEFLEFSWHTEMMDITIAWPFGLQIFYIGIKK